MLRELVLQYKEERDRMLSENYIQRKNIKISKKTLESKLTKVLLGPRRAGKSVMSFLLLKDKNFAYLNFDDENLLKVDNYDKLIQAIFEVYDSPKYLFFDEIQNLKNWELFVNKLQRRGHNIILTGSNAKLLSRELSTSITGRYSAIEILPFSFQEYLQAKGQKYDKDIFSIPRKKGTVLNKLDDYLEIGGYPDIVVKNVESRDYLLTLFDSILFKDIVKRYNVRQSGRLDDLASYFVANFTNEFTYNSLRKSLKFSSTVTAEKYVRYLEESYLFFVLHRFSFKKKEQINSPKKIYLVDNGYVMSKGFKFSPDYGKLMENLVFVEFLRRGSVVNRDIFYYKTRNKREVDFVIKKGNKINSLFQVAFDIESKDTKEREMRSLLEAGEELECSKLYVITWDYEGEEKAKKQKIKFIPLWKFLLYLEYDQSKTSF